MSMRLLVLIGTPMVLVMCPLNFFFGDGDAEKAGDNLSRIAIGNVKNNHPWLYYVYSFITLLVVWAVRTETFRSMKEFCKARANWLKQLQNPQANTVMVKSPPIHSIQRKAGGRHPGGAAARRQGQGLF